MAYPRIDFNRLNQVKNLYLYDMEISKRRVFTLTQENTGFCWHCREVISTVHRIPTNITQMGYFCCSNCMYSYISMRNIDFGHSIVNILNNIKLKYNVVKFTSVPSWELTITDPILEDTLKLIKFNKKYETVFNTSLYYINSDINYIIYKVENEYKSC